MAIHYGIWANLVWNYWQMCSLVCFQLCRLNLSQSVEEYQLKFWRLDLLLPVLHWGDYTTIVRFLVALFISQIGEFWEITFQRNKIWREIWIRKTHVLTNCDYRTCLCTLVRHIFLCTSRQQPQYFEIGHYVCITGTPCIALQLHGSHDQGIWPPCWWNSFVDELPAFCRASEHPLVISYRRGSLVTVSL